MSTVAVSDALKLNQFPSDWELNPPVNKEREKEKGGQQALPSFCFLFFFYSWEDSLKACSPQSDGKHCKTNLFFFIQPEAETVTDRRHQTL